jgi:hypothetical protein
MSEFETRTSDALPRDSSANARFTDIDFNVGWAQTLDDEVYTQYVYIRSRARALRCIHNMFTFVHAHCVMPVIMVDTQH